MINELLAHATDPAAEPDLREVVAEHVRRVVATRGRADRTVVQRAESAVAADPARITVDSSQLATLSIDDASWSAGRFKTRSISDLRGQQAGRAGACRLIVFAGRSPATDIGALQATTGGRPLFQVASQFNCLESPGAYVTPVSNYFSDPTQGPRAAISAFPATLLRHYAAPGENGERFVQSTGHKQLDLLGDVFPEEQSPVRNGYLADAGGFGTEAVAVALEEQFDQICVGVQEDAEVVLGYDWDGAVDSHGQRITQVLTSTVAGGPYGGSGAFARSFEQVCRELLRAAYLGTLLAALDLDCSPVVLTLIGGGVFGNPSQLIWDAILSALDEADTLVSGSLDVIVNTWDAGRLSLPESVVNRASESGGAVVRFDENGLAAVER